MSTLFSDGDVLCADYMNQVDDLLVALCNSASKAEVLACLEVLTDSEIAQQYLALDGSNRMTDQLSLQGADPVETFHAAPKSWIDAQIAGVSSTIGYARRVESQVAHGFTAGQPLYWDGNTWQLALATGLATAGTHLVAEVLGPDSFQVSQFGWVENLSGLQGGALYYVDPTTPGVLTTTEPPFSNPILLAINASLGWAVSQRAIPSAGLDFASQQDVNNGTAGKSLDPAIANANYLLKSATGDIGQLQEIDSDVQFNTDTDFGVAGAGVTITAPDGTLTGAAGNKLTLGETVVDGENENTLQLRRSVTPGEVPASLAEGEALINTEDEVLYFGGAGPKVFPISGGGGGGLVTVDEVAHGYTAVDIGMPMYFTGSAWSPAIASSEATVGVGMLAEIVSVDIFKVQQSGVLTEVAPEVFSGAPLVPGTFYYVSATAGGRITDVEPTAAVGEQSNPIALALTTTSVLVLPWRPQEGYRVSRSEMSWATAAGQDTFVWAHDTAGLDVYLNGAKLVVTDDYTSDGAQIVVASALVLDTDVLYAVSWTSFAVADTYTKTEANTKFLPQNVVHDSTLGAPGTFDLPTIFSDNPQYGAFTIRLFSAAAASAASTGLFLFAYGQSDTQPTGSLSTRIFYIGSGGTVSGYVADATNAMTVFYTPTTVDTAAFRVFSLEVNPERFGVSGNVLGYFGTAAIAEDVAGDSDGTDMPAKGFQLRFDAVNPNFAAGARIVVTGEV